MQKSYCLNVFSTSVSFLKCPVEPCSARTPVTMVQLSTGWDRGVGCRVCGTQAGRRCSVCCGWSVWCCRLTAGHSWLSVFAYLSFHMVCCSSATPLSPNWRTSQEREKQEFWGHLKCQNSEVNNVTGRKRGLMEWRKSLKLSVSRCSQIPSVLFLQLVTYNTMHTWVEGRASGCSLWCLL